MGFTSARGFETVDIARRDVLAFAPAGSSRIARDVAENPAVSVERLPDGRPVHPFTSSVCEALGIVVKSVRMRRLYATVVRASVTPRTTVLVHGPSGSGKELVARMLHAVSSRSSGPFVAINCAALPETLLESELFGHEKGAFSGATERKKGLFEAADRGTILLDEIAEMGPNLQAKLLRALQERSFRRVGGVEPVSVDVRVVAATNRDLAQAVAEGTFRADLYYRLHVIDVAVPALRERPADILPMARAFVDQVSREMGLAPRKLSKTACAALRAHDWPGNVRELRNCVERAVALAPGAVIRAADLGLRAPLEPASVPAAALADRDDTGTLEQVERAHLARVLERCHGNQSRAAAELGIHRTTLAKKIRDYGIGLPSTPLAS